MKTAETFFSVFFPLGLPLSLGTKAQDCCVWVFLILYLLACLPHKVVAASLERLNWTRSESNGFSLGNHAKLR
jgi:hypothetical protein